MNDPKSIDLNIIDRGLDGQEWTNERGKIRPMGHFAW